jgi:hypothetical protein
MKTWEGAGGVRLPEGAEFFPESSYVLASPLPRCSRDGMCAIPPYRVTRETSMRVSVAYWLVGHISESEIDQSAHRGVGAGSSSDDGRDSITLPERRTCTLEMFRREGKGWGESSRQGGNP